MGATVSLIRPLANFIVEQDNRRLRQEVARLRQEVDRLNTDFAVSSKTNKPTMKGKARC